jgi:hypothetical protein
MSVRVSRFVVCAALSVVLPASIARAQNPYDDASPPVTDESAAPPGPSDAQVRREMIAESISAYDGACPCPYNTMRNGAACGGRSAYSRPGGEAPLCYESDITDGMVADYRRLKGYGPAAKPVRKARPKRR